MTNHFSNIIGESHEITHQSLGIKLGIIVKEETNIEWITQEEKTSCSWIKNIFHWWSVGSWVQVYKILEPRNEAYKTNKMRQFSGWSNSPTEAWTPPPFLLPAFLFQGKKINKCSSFALLPFGKLQPHYFTFLNSFKRQPKAFFSRRKQTANPFLCSLFFLTVPRQPLAPLDWWHL